MDSHEQKHGSEDTHHGHQHMASGAASSGKTCEESSTNKLLVGAAVVQILLLIFVSVQLSNLGSIAGAAVADAPAGKAAAAPAAAPTPAVDMEALLDDDDVKGDEDAPVTIIEWSDFECPFCGKFYSQTLSQIDAQYIKTGKVKLIYRDFPLGFHANAQKAAEAAECAGEQNKYYDMHDLLFEKGVEGGVATFKQYAADLKLDTKKFDTCLDSGAMAGEVRKDMADGTAAGIQGTPGFLINGQLVSGAQPFAVFQQVIEAELRQ